MLLIGFMRSLCNMPHSNWNLHVLLLALSCNPVASKTLCFFFWGAGLVLSLHNYFWIYRKRDLRFFSLFSAGIIFCLLVGVFLAVCWYPPYKYLILFFIVVIAFCAALDLLVAIIRAMVIKIKLKATKNCQHAFELIFRPCRNRIYFNLFIFFILL